jgi:hypothetical protein
MAFPPSDPARAVLEVARPKISGNKIKTNKIRTFFMVFSFSNKTFTMSTCLAGSALIPRI